MKVFNTSAKRRGTKTTWALLVDVTNEPLGWVTRTSYRCVGFARCLQNILEYCWRLQHVFRTFWHKHHLNTYRTHIGDVTNEGFQHACKTSWYKDHLSTHWRRHQWTIVMGDENVLNVCWISRYLHNILEYCWRLQHVFRTFWHKHHLNTYWTLIGDVTNERFQHVCKTSWYIIEILTIHDGHLFCVSTM